MTSLPTLAYFVTYYCTYCRLNFNLLRLLPLSNPYYRRLRTTTFTGPLATEGLKTTRTTRRRSARSTTVALFASPSLPTPMTRGTISLPAILTPPEVTFAFSAPWSCVAYVCALCAVCAVCVVCVCAVCLYTVCVCAVRAFL